MRSERVKLFILIPPDGSHHDSIKHEHYRPYISSYVFPLG